MQLPIIADATLPPAKPGDLGARLTGAALSVPPDVATALGRLSVGNAEELVSYLQSFPSAIASALQWTPDEVSEARQKLVAMLRGKVPDALLDPPPAIRRAYGAMDPSSYGRDRRP